MKVGSPARASLSRLLAGRRERARGSLVVALGDHQAPRDRADAAFDEARVLVEHEAVDAGIPQQGLEPRTGGPHRSCATIPSSSAPCSRAAVIGRDGAALDRPPLSFYAR